MRSLILTLVCAVFSLNALPYAHIFESPDITELEPYVNERTLVLLDIDNTILRSKTSLGSGSWYYHMVEEAMAKGIPTRRALRMARASWDKIVPFVQVEPTNPKIPQWIQSLEKRGIPLLAFTARPHFIAIPTLNHLNSLNIDLSHSPFEQFPLFFSLGSPVKLIEGVLFSHDYNNKGEVLLQFLRQIKPFFPKINRILFADDSESHIEDARIAAFHTRMEFVGLRCSSEDERKAHFNPLIAEKQRAILEGVLPDDEAVFALMTEEGRELLRYYRDPISEPERIDFSISTIEHQSSNTVPQSEYSDSKIIEIDSITDLTEWATPNSLVVFALNDTLLSVNQTLGSSRWAYPLIKDYMRRGFSRAEAFDRLVPFWHTVLLKSSVKAAENETAYVVRQLQKKGCSTIGLTARYPEIAYCTLKQLKELYIDFTKSDIAKHDCTIFTPYSAKFLGGVIFAGLQNDKGAVLAQFLEQCNPPFDRLIFIDDRIEHVKRVEKVAMQIKKPFIGIWYRAVNQTGTPIDFDAAKIQAVAVSRIIPDSLAKKLIEFETLRPEPL